MGGSGPLAGVRVIELTTMITGPLAGMMLGDWGADVVKVENPDGGDPFRNFREGMYSPHFCAYNRNKRSVALDLRFSEGKAALRELLRTADVVLENYRPGVMQRLGFGDEVLVEANSRLVRCSITGFGPKGPYAARPAYDAIAQAVTGMTSLFVQQDDPRLMGPTISDNVTGQYACQGILAALYEREKTGKGRRIDVNMMEATLAFMPDPFAYYTQMDLVSDPYLRVHTSQSFAYACSDGKLLAVHLSSQVKFWEAFVRAIKYPEMLDDPRFATRSQRITNYEFLRGCAAKVIGRRQRDHWMDVLTKADVPCAPIHNITEVFDDPQIKHLDSFMSLEHPKMGSLVSIRRPVYLDGSRSEQPQRAPPMLGEHTREVLAEAGISLTHREKENP